MHTGVGCSGVLWIMIGTTRGRLYSATDITLLTTLWCYHATASTTRATWLCMTMAWTSLRRRRCTHSHSAHARTGIMTRP
ncbi:hypothetical protein BDZ94DRAFT_1052864 [Collybia nuda]|uniref:Uncharacterized protein n=1 Tax=Collybia nuda TaxID=64659 RepID=A0A9P5XY97_9AGAR|nr:hypothetical protein BDZ94DRAFT_1052864 [Collybia nuda]